MLLSRQRSSFPGSGDLPAYSDDLAQYSDSARDVIYSGDSRNRDFDGVAQGLSHREPMSPRYGNRGIGRLARSYLEGGF